jgi:hypothetical protein
VNRRNSFSFLLGLCLLGVGLLGCAGEASSRSDLSPEQARRKLLEYQGSRFHQRQFFVGTGEASTLDAATAQAHEAITKQLIWLPSTSQGLLVGMYRVERSVIDRDGSVHVLATLERDAAASHLRRLALENEAQGRHELEGCQKLFKASEIARARECLSQTNLKISAARDLFAASRAVIGDPAQQAALPEEGTAVELKQTIDKRSFSANTVVLRILEYIDGNLVGDRDTDFFSMLQESGYSRIVAQIPTSEIEMALSEKPEALVRTAQSASAGYAIAGRVTARFSSEDHGQFFSFAEGILRVFEVTSGRAVAEAACNGIKGGHVSRLEASKKASKLASIALVDQLKGKLNALRSK